MNDVPYYDQRGVPFTRGFDGDNNGTSRIDMGSFEVQVLPNLAGDFNRNENVDAADYVLWRKSKGTNVSNYTGADGDGDGTIDQDDYGVWRGHFGQSYIPDVGSGSTVPFTTQSGSVGTILIPRLAHSVTGQSGAQLSRSPDSCWGRYRCVTERRRIAN